MTVRHAYGINGLAHDCAIIYERVLGGCIHCSSDAVLIASNELLAIFFGEIGRCQLRFVFAQETIVRLAKSQVWRKVQSATNLISVKLSYIII